MPHSARVARFAALARVFRLAALPRRRLRLLLGRLKCFLDLLSDVLVVLVRELLFIITPRGCAPRTPPHARSWGPKCPTPLAWLASLRSLASSVLPPCLAVDYVFFLGGLNASWTCFLMSL